MKIKATEHLKKRARTRLNIPNDEVMRLYRHGRPVTAADLPRFGRVDIGSGRTGRIVLVEGMEVLVIACQRGRKLITVLLPLEEWEALKGKRS
ncbi:hypothetical protein FBQ95_16940 [Chloroflexi bacterium CFX3]|nr:hypothetical protein [Chloroflexi bacterium CFX3]